MIASIAMMIIFPALFFKNSSIFTSLTPYANITIPPIFYLEAWTFVKCFLKNIYVCTHISHIRKRKTLAEQITSCKKLGSVIKYI